MADIKILVAAHKPYWMPADAVYLPVQVGAAGKPSIDPAWQRDDEGGNISARNPEFCELTALYWAWKNLACDFIGLCHYRRYFGRRILHGDGEKRRAAIFGRADYERLLAGADILLPTKRNYYIETVYSQYAHAHRASDLDALRQLMAERCPEYLAAWEAVMRSRRLHILNMFVMRRELFDAYVAWLFDLLFALDAQLAPDDLGRARLFGFLAERLFNVWVKKQGLRARETSVVMLEPVNWLKKGSAFLKRKLGKRP